MEVQQIRRDLWRWTAPHPDWKPESGGPGGWEQQVGCVFYAGPDAVVLIDPLAPPAGTPDADRFWKALDDDVARQARPVAVLLTCAWHDRSAQAVYDRYAGGPGASIWAYEGGRERMDVTVTRSFVEGDPLPGGVQAFAPGGLAGEEALFYLPPAQSLVVGDLLIGAGESDLRLAWLDDGEAQRKRICRGLCELLALPIEAVLVSHGTPVLTKGRPALAAALEKPIWGK
jgi:hypothetical protein